MMLYDSEFKQVNSLCIKLIEEIRIGYKFIGLGELYT